MRTTARHLFCFDHSSSVHIQCSGVGNLAEIFVQFFRLDHDPQGLFFNVVFCVIVTTVLLNRQSKLISLLMTILL